MFPLTIDTILFQFIIFSFLGWLLELLYRSLRYSTLVNPGFNRGPYVPLYGITAVIITLIYSFIGGYSIYTRAFIYLIVTTLLELVTGSVLLSLFNKRYWDYRENFRNYQGLICPSFSLAWVACCFVFEFLLYPLSVTVIKVFPLTVIKSLNVLFMLSLTLDFFYSSGLIHLGRMAIKRRFPEISYYIEPIRLNIQNIISGALSMQLAPRKIINIIQTMPGARELISQYQEQVNELRSRFRHKL